MRIQFLGTAAAEGYPAIFCNCAYCREARALGGRNLRYRSALLVNDNLLIDFGPDLLAAAQRFNRSLYSVTTGLLTHAHSDHFLPSNFEMRHKDFTGSLEIPTLRLYGSRDMLPVLEQLPRPVETLQMEVKPVTAFERWEDSGYQFTAYRAFHAITHLEEALFYSIDDGKHALLYATDTGPFPEETWQALEGRSFDVIILEETMGDGVYNQHLGYDGFLEHVQRMRGAGMLRPGGRVLAHHFSHSGNPPYDKLVKFFAPHDVEVAYDGLEINLVDRNLL